MANRLYGNVQFDYKLHFLPDLHVNLNLGLDDSKGWGSVHVPGDAAQQWGTTTNHGQNYQYQGTNITRCWSLSLTILKTLLI